MSRERAVHVSMLFVASGCKQDGPPLPSPLLPRRDEREIRAFMVPFLNLMAVKHRDGDSTKWTTKWATKCGNGCPNGLGSLLPARLRCRGGAALLRGKRLWFRGP